MDSYFTVEAYLYPNELRDFADAAKDQNHVLKLVIDHNGLRVFEIDDEGKVLKCIYQM